MRLAGYQPQYFPRLHYFARILDADIFAISDYLQFVKAHTYPQPDGSNKRGKSYQADTPIKSSQGVQYLTVPVRHQGLQPINETGIAYEKSWSQKHLVSLKVSYSRARTFGRIFPQLEQLLAVTYKNLAQLNATTIFWGLSVILGANIGSVAELTGESMNELLQEPHPFRLRRIVLKSETAIPPPDKNRDANQHIIETCQALGANEYYHGGTAATAYVDHERISKAGIILVKQNWLGQPYTQLFPKAGFIPNLSIIDLLANEDTKKVQHILKTG